jgi:hypothetical protein
MREWNTVNEQCMDRTIEPHQFDSITITIITDVRRDYCTYFICAQQWPILIYSKSNLFLDEMFSVCSDLSETVGDVLSLQVERAHDVILQTAQVHLVKGKYHERAPSKGTASQGRP